MTEPSFDSTIPAAVLVSVFICGRSLSRSALKLKLTRSGAFGVASILQFSLWLSASVDLPHVMCSQDS